MRGSAARRIAALALALGSLAWAYSCAAPHGRTKVKPEDPFLAAHREKAGELAGGKTVHAPVKSGDCSACHSSASEPKKMSAKMPEMCYGCHPQGKADMAKKVKHSPFEGGDCSGCHDPHSSDNPALLPDKVNAFCVNCHQPDSDGLKKAHFGITVIASDCTACHNPHASEREKLILERVVHVPFEGGNCDSCHAKTGADGKSRLLPGGAKPCFACHSDLETAGKGEKGHPPFGSGECQTCHWPHATGERALLREPVSTLCRTCHEGIPEVGHPTAEHPTFRKGKMNPMDKEKPFDCVSCHSPHRAKVAHFLLDTREKLCGRCHGK